MLNSHALLGILIINADKYCIFFLASIPTYLPFTGYPTAVIETGTCVIYLFIQYFRARAIN